MILALMACVFLASTALAQTSAPPATEGTSTPPAQSPASSNPAVADLEPAVDTSATAAPLRQSTSVTTAVPSAAAPSNAASAPSGRSQRGGRVMDRVELEATQITGNAELPKVLYIVPWKRSDLGDLVGKPVNSLLDEVLTPVDRDVFRRQNRYYEALSASEGQRPSSDGSGPQSGSANPQAETAGPEK
jgi:hypothetical protein